MLAVHRYHACQHPRLLAGFARASDEMIASKELSNFLLQFGIGPIPN